MTRPASPDTPPGPAQRGEQTGKRSSEERNDPEVEPGPRIGQPATRRRHEERDTDRPTDTDE